MLLYLTKKLLLLKKLLALSSLLMLLSAPMADAALVASASISRVGAIGALSVEKNRRADVIEAFLADNPLPENATPEDRERYHHYNILKRSLRHQAHNLARLSERLVQISRDTNLSHQQVAQFENLLTRIENEMSQHGHDEFELIPAQKPEVTQGRRPASDVDQTTAALEEIETSLDLSAERRRRRGRGRSRGIMAATTETEAVIEGGSEDGADSINSDNAEIQLAGTTTGDAPLITTEVEVGSADGGETDETTLSERRAIEAIADVELQADLARQRAEEERRQRDLEEQQRQRVAVEALADLENTISEEEQARQRAAEEDRLLQERTEARAAALAVEEAARVNGEANTVVATETTVTETEEETETGDLSSGVIQYVELTCQTALNVRRQPNTSSERLEDVPCRDYNNHQTKVLILDEENGFYKVFVNGALGWISGEHTTTPQDVGQEDENRTSFYEPQQGRLNCRSRLNRRSGPSTRYRIVGKIPCRQNGQGTPVTILGRHEDTGWYIAEYNGERTWVSNRYVDVADPNALRTLTDEIIQGLDSVPGLGDASINCAPGSMTQTGDCINFNHSFYTREDSARQMAASINEAKQRGTNAKKQRFFELFGPIAVEIQSKTGWPASVALAQMALETAWGTSNVFKRLNNFGGHSCWERDPNGSRPLRNQHLINAASQSGRELPGYFRTGSTHRIQAACTYPRPRNEGAYYRSFNNVVEAAYLYADNVLENRAYRDAQNHVKSRFAAGQKADPSTVVRGLRAYAADGEYRNSLLRTIRANDLTRFDNMTTCD